MTNNAIHSQPGMSRRTALAGLGVAAAWAGIPGMSRPVASFQGATPEPTLLPELVIDLPGGLPSIDPALAYSPREWSVVHSIYDAPIGFAEDGSLRPLAAQRFEGIADGTFEIVLREGLTFHDGAPVTADAIKRSIAYIQESASYAVDLFSVITRVEIVDELTARIVCGTPSPWLPAQIAVWLLLVPEGFSADTAARAPIGSGPYRFEGYEPDDRITLVRNDEYPIDSLKGIAMANRVTYRFVPEAGTRVADLSTGAAQIVTDLPIDQLAAVEESGGQAIELPLVGTAWIRIATDIEPFSDPRVRKALNHAVDVQAIANALVSTQSRRLASLFPDGRSIAFNGALTPYEFNPELARALLSGAGLADGFETELEITASASRDVVLAIVAQLGDVGIRASIVASEYADFNATWADASRPPLRMSTWSPLYDPHTLLSLVFQSTGFLSRYRNPDVDRLIGAAAVEAEPAIRRTLYQDLSRVMYDDAPALFLWNLASAYGVSEDAAAWQPRGDEYVIATVTAE